jgi:ectoine hydroxylase-related dioxygenase (phytanoyl-CoA dioxygenase family)
MLSRTQIEKYDNDGYLVLENFFTSTQCENLSKEVNKIIGDTLATEDADKIPVFPSFKDLKTISHEDMNYFLGSANRVRLFMKKKYQPQRGSNQVKVAEIRANANKIGHALHALNPLFKEATFSQNSKNIVKSLNYKKPIVCQSVYVLKSEFSSPDAPGHQDSTFVHVEPDTLIGLWVAIEETTEENGCLKVIPGSHKDGVQRKFIVGLNNKSEKVACYTADPVNYDQNRWISVPVKAGSAILLNGAVVHKSTSNKSPVSRDVYAFHVYDADKSTFSKDNWMNYSDDTFLPLI